MALDIKEYVGNKPVVLDNDTVPTKTKKVNSKMKVKSKKKVVTKEKSE